MTGETPHIWKPVPVGYSFLEGDKCSKCGYWFRADADHSLGGPGWSPNPPAGFALPLRSPRCPLHAGLP